MEEYKPTTITLKLNWPSVRNFGGKYLRSWMLTIDADLIKPNKETITQNGFTAFIEKGGGDNSITLTTSTDSPPQCHKILKETSLAIEYVNSNIGNVREIQGVPTHEWSPFICIGELSYNDPTSS